MHSPQTCQFAVKSLRWRRESCLAAPPPLLPAAGSPAPGHEGVWSETPPVHPPLHSQSLAAGMTAVHSYSACTIKTITYPLVSTEGTLERQHMHNPPHHIPPDLPSINLLLTVLLCWQPASRGPTGRGAQLSFTTSFISILTQQVGIFVLPTRNSSWSPYTAHAQHTCKLTTNAWGRIQMPYVSCASLFSRNFSWTALAFHSTGPLHLNGLCTPPSIVWGCALFGINSKGSRANEYPLQSCEVWKGKATRRTAPTLTSWSRILAPSAPVRQCLSAAGWLNSSI